MMRTVGAGRRRAGRSTTPRSRRRSASSTAGTRCRGERLPVRVHSCARRCCLELALVQCVDRPGRRRTASRRSSPPVARPRAARWRRPGSSRPTAPRCTRSTAASCSSSARARSRSRRCTAASTLDADALPARYVGLLDVLPARGRHLRQGHPGHLPRPPVRQGRDVLVLRTRNARRRARADPRDRGGRSSAASGCRTASSTSRPATSAPPRPRSTTSRRGCRRRAATASSPRARTTPTTRPAGSARG